MKRQKYSIDQPQKKLKCDESNRSDHQLRENLYSQLYPSPNSSIDNLRHARKSDFDMSRFSISLEHEIDNLLKITIPEYKKNSCITEEVPKFKQSIIEEQQQEYYPHSKMKINLNDVYCEASLCDIPRPVSTIKQPTPKEKLKFMQELINRYQRDKPEKLKEISIEQITDLNQVYQDLSVQQEKDKLFDNQNEIIVEKPSIQQPNNKNNRKSNNRRKSKKVRVQPVEQKIICEPTKQIRTRSTDRKKSEIKAINKDSLVQKKKQKGGRKKKFIEYGSKFKPKYGPREAWKRFGCNWKGYKLRKEAQLYPKYKQAEYDLFCEQICDKFYIHEREGKFEFMKWDRNNKACFCLTVNPRQCIGPVSLKNPIECYFKSHRDALLYLSRTQQATKIVSSVKYEFGVRMLIYNPNNYPITAFFTVQLNKTN